MKTPGRKAVAVAAAIMLGLSACSTGAEPTAPANTGSAAPQSGTVELVYLQKQGDQQYFVDQAKGAQDKAAELGDVKVTVVNLGTDSNKAISEVDAAIARGVDGIILVAPDQAIGPQVAEKAAAAGIPLLASDDVLKDNKGGEVPFVGFDGTDMGNSVGKKAAELYKAAGWTAENTKIMSVTKLDLSVCQLRVEGAAATFKADAADMPEIITVGTDNSVTNAMDRAGATYTANSDVKNWVVWGCNDETETGAVTALQNAGVAPENIIGVGLGAYLTCKDWGAGLETGNKAALYISGIDVGSAAVEAMVAKVRDGVELPPVTVANTTMVDATNYKEAGVVCT